MKDSRKIRAFITYAHMDKTEKDDLRESLAVIERGNELITWDDGQLTPADEALQEDILEKVADSDMLIYLVSHESLASENCNRELAEAVNRDMRIIPVILEHCDWLNCDEIKGFEALPEKGKPITQWEYPDEGWQNVVDGIRKVVLKMQTPMDGRSGKSKEELQVEVALNAGNSQLILGQLDKAIAEYSEAIRLNPYHANARNNRGFAYKEIGEIDLALRDYDEAIKLMPEDDAPYLHRGLAYESKGDLDRAINDFTKAIELNRNDALVYRNRGRVKSELDRHNEAILDYDKAIRLDPNDPATYVNRGRVKSKLGRYEGAILDYDKAIEFALNDASIYINRGKAQFSLEQYEKALFDYDKAIEVDPDSALAYINRGGVKSELGWYEEAILDCNQAIELNPDLDLVGAYINRGITQLRMERADEANVDFKIALQLAKRDANEQLVSELTKQLEILQLHLRRVTIKPQG